MWRSRADNSWSILRSAGEEGEGDYTVPSSLPCRPRARRRGSMARTPGNGRGLCSCTPGPAACTAASHLRKFNKDRDDVSGAMIPVCDMRSWEGLWGLQGDGEGMTEESWGRILPLRMKFLFLGVAFPNSLTGIIRFFLYAEKVFNKWNYKFFPLHVFNYNSHQSFTRRIKNFSMLKLNNSLIDK